MKMIECLDQERDVLLKIQFAKLEDRTEIARVHVQSWRTTYKGIFPQKYLDQLSIDERAAGWYRIIKHSPNDSHLLIARNHNNEIVGFASCGAGRDFGKGFGEVYAIYLLEEYQKKGIGRSLFQLSLSLLKKEGFKSVGLWAAEGGPAEQFYQRAGGHAHSQKIETIAGTDVNHVMYVWKDLHAIPDFEIFHIKDPNRDSSNLDKYFSEILKKDDFVHCSFAYQLPDICRMLGIERDDERITPVDYERYKERLSFDAKDFGSDYYPHIW